ncbi:MAG: SMC family ATPase [Gemmatimonadaceae bacterium]|nr:SMC family ATPase [Gemmatimonadaceae bacterium]NUS32473.1 SMC family ATPase [Gemmatimonadaceae bacterium]NUS49351.1 SMC family ATPase [Gemmatimonadaceae bacterium]
MRLNSLRLCNFRQHCDSYISFDTGLTGIIGANGSGKTTILEAIAWALYGQDAARGRKETIRSLRAGPGAKVTVELDFELGGHRYRVKRGLTQAELYLDGADTPVANSISGVTDVLRRRLGMSREEFFNTYFTGQKELDVMAAMAPSERAQFLSRVLGYERLRIAQRLVKDQARMIAAEAAGVRSTMPDMASIERVLADATERLAQASARASAATARRDRANRTLADVVPRWLAAQREREQLQEALAELRVAESEAASYARDAERVGRELAEVASAESELERLGEELAPLGPLSEELQRLDQLARDEGRRQALLEQERSLAEEVRRLRERRAKIETAPQLEEEVTLELEQRRAMLELVQGELEAKRTEWVRDRQEAETKHVALRQQYAEVKENRERLIALGEDGQCPICERTLEDHYRTVLDHLDEQLDALVADGKYYKSRLEQLEEMPPEIRELDERRRATFEEVGKLERRLAKVQLAVQELGQVTRDLTAKAERFDQVCRDREQIPGGYDQARHAAARRELERLRPLDARATRLATQLERQPALVAERDRAAAGLAAAQSRIVALTARRNLLSFSEQSYAELRATHDAAATELRSAELDAVAASGEASAAQASVARAEQARAEVAQARGKLDALDRQKRLHDELDRAYTDLRTDLNVQLRPEMSELASAFLTELTDARYDELELDDSYNLTVLEDGVPKPVISGGEQDVANLCLRLAISQMIAERAGQSFSLLILDEVFGSLDESRRQNVVELLRGLGDRFEQVILITHVEQVREGLDRVISVRYDEETGCSVVGQTEAGAPEGELLASLGAA